MVNIYFYMISFPVFTANLAGVIIASPYCSCFSSPIRAAITISCSAIYKVWVILSEHSIRSKFTHASNRAKPGLGFIFSCILAFVNRVFLTANLAYFCNETIRASCVWLELSGRILRNALHRTITRVTISPVYKLFSAPLANKGRMLRRIGGLVVSIRTCLRTEFSTCIYRGNAKYSPALNAFYKYILRYYSAIPRTKTWGSVITPVGKFNTAYFASCFHRIVSSLIHSRLIKGAHRLECGACQIGIGYLKPNTIISQAIAGGG